LDNKEIKMEKILNGINVHKDNTCASHMPIQMELLNNFEIKSVLELGVGYYSTKLFLERCKNVISIESDSQEWFDKMSDFYKEYKNWKHLFLKQLSEIKEILNTHKKFDLIFVDGSEFRAEETNVSFEFADVIIGHDTQWWFRDRYNVPSNYKQIDFKFFPIEYGHNAGYDERPWTTLFTNNESVFNHFACLKESDLYNTYKFPYVYIETPNKL